MAFLAVAIACGAQDAPVIRLTGQLGTGFQDLLQLSGTSLSDAISLYDFASGKPSRFRVELQFAAPDGNWGITTRLDSEVLSNGGLSATWNQALVWGKVLNGLIGAKAGLLDEEGFSFSWYPWGVENIWGGQYDGNLGVEVQLSPLSWLTVGYVLPVLDGTRWADTIDGSYLGAAITVPNAARIVAGASLGLPYATTAWIGADLMAVEGLVARAAAQATNIGSTYSVWVELYEEAGYPLAGILLNVKGWEEVYGAPGSSVGWQVEPSVGYAFGPVTVSVVGDGGTLLAKDPNPAVGSLPLGYAVGLTASCAPVASSTIQVGARYLVPDSSVQTSTLQTFVDFRWTY